MRFNKLYEKKLNPEQTAVSSGVQTLGTDQWMGTYKFSKDVAGHDGEKQHAPDSPSGNDVYTDKAIVVGYSDTDDKMTKAAMNGKVKQTVGSGSEEPENVNAKSPLSKNEDVSKGLPDHLKKHFDKDGNPIKGSWKDGKWTPNKDSEYQVKDVTPKGYGPNEDVSESSEIKVPTEDGITMQDIRLMAGEGKLTQKTIKQAIEIIRKQRKEKQTKLKEAQNIYHLNRTGFARGPRDSERHDLDVSRTSPQEWALKINGKVWSKDGKTVTFNSKEQALKVRQSLLAKRPELEVGLVTRGGTTEAQGDIDVDTYADALIKRDKQNLSRRNVAHAARIAGVDEKKLLTAIQLKVGRIKEEAELDEDVGAQIADLIRKKNSATSPVARKNIDSQIAQLKRQRDKMNEEPGMAEDKIKGADGKACWDGYRYNGTEDGKDSCVKVGEAEVRHDRYMRSHGKKASGGHGSWMFTNKEYGEPGDDETFTAPPGKFSDAVKHAKKWAKEKGHYSVYAMEDGLDETSLATMRDFFAGDEEARDPYEITKQRLHFSKDKNNQSAMDKRFPSKEAYLNWLEQQKQVRELTEEELDELNRRDFLKLAGTGAAIGTVGGLAAFGNPISKLASLNDTKIKIRIENVRSNHVPNRSQDPLTVILDLTEKTVLVSRHGSVKVKKYVAVPTKDLVYQGSYEGVADAKNISIKSKTVTKTVTDIKPIPGNNNIPYDRHETDTKELIISGDEFYLLDRTEFVWINKNTNKETRTPTTNTGREMIWTGKVADISTFSETKEDAVDEDVIYRLDKENPMNDTEVLVIGGAGRYSLDGLRNKARKEVEQLAKDLAIDHGGAFRRSAHNVRQLQNTLNTIVAAYDELNQLRKLGGMRSKGIKDEDATVMREGVELMEKWTQKYKNSINCSDPKGFSQKAHCAGKKK